MRKSPALLAAVFVVYVLAAIPNFAGFAFPPAGGCWTGILSRNTADVNGYISIIEEIRQGHNRARNLMTGEPHPPFQIRPLFTALGLAGRILPGISTVVLMETGRLITSLGLLLLLMLISRQAFTTVREQVVCFFILALGSGIGWTGLIYDSPDLRIVETSTLLTLISPPLYSLSLLLSIGAMLCIDRAPRNFRFAVLAAVCGIWLGLDRPFALAPLSCAIGGTAVVELLRDKKWNSLLRVLPYVLAVSLCLAYQLQLLRSIPVYAEWNRQHVLPTPEWYRLVAALGLLIPLAMVGVAPMLRTLPRLGAMLCFYWASSLLFSHLNFPQQERFLEGLPFSTALPAAFGMIRLLRRLSNAPLQTATATVILALLCLSPFVAITRDLEAIARQSPPQYMPCSLLQAMQQLAHLSQSGDVVFSAEASGNFIAAYAGRQVVLGHRVQTANYFEKRKLVGAFLRQNAEDPNARKVFISTGASWLFWGPEEAWLAKNGFDPERAPFLQRDFANRFAKIYRLKQQ